MAYRFPNSLKNINPPITIVLIILIGFFLRLYHIAAAPWRDEAFSVQYWAGAASRLLADKNSDA